jgi:hypothetical protein
MATANRPRTYHNSAMLQPDGRVLVGGHAPINTAYLFSITVPGFSPNDGRDPSFEIYSPPYTLRSDRPTITSAPAQVSPGQLFTIQTPQAASIGKVCSSAAPRRRIPSTAISAPCRCRSCRGRRRRYASAYRPSGP